MIGIVALLIIAVVNIVYAIYRWRRPWSWVQDGLIATLMSTLTALLIWIVLFGGGR
ncbi:hypothetical protein ACIBTV_26695 [Micromonospora sp. NPDC049366]|uniref:hypothetical protein n=1 Tax=Micromonospora sp. NPDC049366 TaxID=3364271 RepID=UPI00378E5B6B